MNQLEEKLSIIQRRKKVLDYEIKNETDRVKLMCKIEALNVLKNEEEEILKTLGVN